MFLPTTDEITRTAYRGIPSLSAVFYLIIFIWIIPRIQKAVRIKICFLSYATP